MNWPTVRAKLLDVISQCVRVDTYWRDREQDAIRLNTGNDADVVCRLHISGTRSNGRDDFRRELNNGTNQLDVTQAGNRVFTVSCLVESFDQSDSKFSLEYTERVRDCMQRPKVLAMLRLAGITVASMGTSLDVSYALDGRQVSAASVDLTVSAVVNEHTGDGLGLEADDWIEQVGGDGTTATDVKPVTGTLE